MEVLDLPVLEEVRERQCPRHGLLDPKVSLGSPSAIIACQLVRKPEVCECSLF